MNLASIERYTNLNSKVQSSILLDGKLFKLVSLILTRQTTLFGFEKSKLRSNLYGFAKQRHFYESLILAQDERWRRA